MRAITTMTMMLAVLSLMSASISGAEAQNQPMPERCKVDPAPPAGDESQPTDPSTTESLTDKLDDCNAVLVPPSVGDGEIVTEPPNVGTMPVIRPEEVPPQTGSEPN